MTVEELETLNPEIKENLEIGQNLRLNKNTPAATKTAVTATSVKQEVQYMEYQVQPKRDPVQFNEIVWFVTGAIIGVKSGIGEWCENRNDH